MKNTLTALILAAGFSSSALSAMESDEKSQDTKPKPASFTVSSERKPKPGESFYEYYQRTAAADDHIALERHMDELYENPNAIPYCSDDDILASAARFAQCRAEFAALEKALGPCVKSSLLTSPVISQTIGIGTSHGAGAYVYPDLHEHFHDKAMTQGDSHLFVFDLDDSSTSTITTSSSSHDLGQKKSTDTERAAIEKSMQEDDEPRIPKIIHRFDPHAAPFFESALPPLPYFLPTEHRIKLAAEIITALQSASTSEISTKMPKEEDLKADGTFSPVIISNSTDWKRAHQIIAGLDKSPVQMPKIEEVD
jgi:hypothetical protein